MANRHERRKAEAERKAGERAEYLKERARRLRAAMAGASIGDPVDIYHPSLDERAAPVLK